MPEFKPITQFSQSGSIAESPPNEGQVSLNVTLNFAAEAYYEIDVTNLQQSNKFSVPECMLVDNSKNGKAIEVFVTQTRQSFPVPPFTAGIFPLVAQSGSRIQLSCAGGSPLADEVSISIFNFPYASATWNGFAPLVDGARVTLIGVDAVTNQGATNPIIVGGNNGGAPVALKVDGTGRLEVVGAAAGGVAYGPDAPTGAITQSPILMGGATTTSGAGTVNRWVVDVNGCGSIQGRLGTGTSPAGVAGLMIGGSDGTNYRHTLVDASGRTVITGGNNNAAVALSASGLIVGGLEGTNFRALQMTAGGFVRTLEESTVVAGTAIAGLRNVPGAASVVAADTAYTAGQMNWLTVLANGRLRVEVVGAVTLSAAPPLNTGATPAINVRALTGADSEVLQVSNANRKGLAIYAEVDTLISLAATCTAAVYSFKMVSGDYYEVPFNYTGTVSAKSSAAGNVRVTEITA